MTRMFLKPSTSAAAEHKGTTDKIYSANLETYIFLRPASIYDLFVYIASSLPRTLDFSLVSIQRMLVAVIATFRFNQTAFN